MRLIRILTVQIVVIGALGLPVQIAQAQSEPNPSKPWESSAPDYGRPFDVQPVSRPEYRSGVNSDPKEAPTKTAEVEWKHPNGVACGPSTNTTEPACRVFIETWLPQQKEGKDASGEPWPDPSDKKWPVVFHPTIYASGNSCPGEGTVCAVGDVLVQKGYAFSIIHLPGSGNSPGCFDRHGEADAAAMSAAVEYLATAEWSKGKLGAAGFSYAGGAIVNVAARGTPAAKKAIKAIMVGAPHISEYETQWIFDGVRSAGISAAHSVGYIALKNGVAPGGKFLGDPLENGDPKEYVEDRKDRRGLDRDYGCHDHVVKENATNREANVSDYYDERDLRLAVEDIETPVFVMHGHADLVPISGVPPIVQAGFFDQLPGGTSCGPKACKRGLFGVWAHDMPSSHALAEKWERGDFGPGILTAWFDRWLKGYTSIKVKEWPVAQVQGTDGQWRAEPNWPTTGGPVGQLALGPATEIGGVGSLGQELEPTGQSSYTETVGNDLELKPGQQLVFETKPLDDRLQITGQPVADLWVKLDKEDAHIAARLEILDADGKPIRQYARRGESSGWTYGLRSVQHMKYNGDVQAGLRNNVFVQDERFEAPIGTEIRVPVRFQPTDLVVPPGGKLRLTISGSEMVNTGLQQLEPKNCAEFPDGKERCLNKPSGFEDQPNDPLWGFSEPSGAATTVTLLHTCDVATKGPYAGTPKVSTLRFLMPRANPDLLNVREAEKDEEAKRDEAGVWKNSLANNPFEGEYVSDGGGLATARVCGQKPSRIMDVISSLGRRTPR